MSDANFSAKLLGLVKKLNRFVYNDKCDKVVATLTVSGKSVGLLGQDVLDELRRYPDVFELRNPVDGGTPLLGLADTLDTYERRSDAVAEVIDDMRRRDAHVSLRGWRDEKFEVATSPNHPPMFEVERAAVSMLGVQSFGAHMNGYVNHPTRGTCLWIARRSAKKATFPAMLDNMVAGGIGRGVGIRETLIKECEEEAGIPEELAERAIPVGMISYIYQDERGIQRDVQYCYDLEVPVEFEPRNTDGEVQEFHLRSIQEVKELIVQDVFKPNCAAVTLDFLIRKGFISPDNVADYVEIIQLLHYRY